MAEAPIRHCEPSGLASGKPKDRLREAIQSHSLDVSLDCFAALAMTVKCLCHLYHPTNMSVDHSL